MDWCTMIVVFVCVYIVIQLIRLVYTDCDLQLQWAEKLGKSTGVLARKVVWITGASSGIGEHLAYQMAQAGCRLVLSARREEELERVKKECLSFGNLMDDDVLVLPLDMLKYDRHKPAVEEVISRFQQIDVLVNNAGRSQRAGFEETELAVDREIVELNVLSVISLTKHVLPHMVKIKQGHIVNVSSVAGKMGVYGSASYSGSKHAIQGWFDSLRLEMYGMNKNIAVTNLCLGPVFSNILQTCFTGKQGEMLHGAMKEGEKRMSTDRCARLCAVTIANKLDEVWIARQPILLALYQRQYLPSIFNIMYKKMGMKAAQKMREGQY